MGCCSNGLQRDRKTYDEFLGDISSCFSTKGRQVVDGMEHRRLVRHYYWKRGRRQNRLVTSLVYQVTSHPMRTLCIALRKLCRMDAILSHPSKDKYQVLPHTEYVTLEHWTPTNVARNPLDQFRSWFKEAIEGGVVKEPEAMSLSTATPSGIPSARVVLLKQVDSRGFVFFTNYTSRKSQEIVANPHAALVFYWREVCRSVRVVGSVEKLSREESDAYIRTRPVGSQLAAWASRQSTVIKEGVLEERLEKAAKRFGDGEIPPPDFWGGWRIIPMYVNAQTSRNTNSQNNQGRWSSGVESPLDCTTVCATFVPTNPPMTTFGE